MSSDHDPVMCASVDHRYWTFTVIWCPHRQQFTLRRSTYVETGRASGIDQYESSAIGLGPFDGPYVVKNLLRTWIDEASEGWVRASPRPPG